MSWDGDSLARLAGGDRRSVGAVAAVVEAARGDPSALAALIVGMDHRDPVLRMRCADAAEKLTRDDPASLAPHAARLLALARRDLGQEARWHLAQMLSRLTLDAAGRRRVEKLLTGWLGDDSRIVRVCAIQGLADLARDDAALRGRVLALAQDCATSGTPSLRARARKLLAGLA